MTAEQAILAAYLQHFPEDIGRLKLLQDQLAADEPMLRDNFRGHLTAAGIVLNPERTALAMVLHPHLKRWLQPGGHLEPADADLLAAARREVEEETGLSGLEQAVLFNDPLMPIDIETHYIPANPKKGEPEHYHHDFRYVFIVSATETESQPDKAHDFAWIAFEDKRMPPGLQRSISRLRTLNIVKNTT